MPYQLHTRAGLTPPYQTTDKRFLNTGSGGSGTGTGVIADGFAGSQITIELETVLGEYNTAQSSALNFLLHGSITNTSANNYAGIHWLADGKIRVIAGASIATRSVTSINSYAPGDFVKIRWVLSFASITSGLVGTQELFINDVSQGANSARSDQFATSGGRFALNSVCADHNSVRAEQFTDQYIRRFYINYADGEYERNWDFSQSTGFEVPNSANATVDPLKLFGGNGINTLGTNWPEDNSQWVFYDDGGGSTEQITTSGGIVSALAGGAASTQIINEQVLSASGIAAAVVAGIASAAIVNEQVNSTGGIASAVASGSASTSAINEQALSSGGIAAAIAGATASTQVINEQTSEQIVSSGGIAASTGSAAASTQVIHEQVVSSGGVAGASAGGTASSTVIEEFTVVQVVQSGGISSAYMSGIASTSQVVEQIVSSGGVAAAVMTGSASTIVRELSGDWGAPEILFSEAQPIEQISLTFDQLGRPLVFYRVGENTLKLYWYDPVAQQNVTTTLTTGKDPTACFDFPQDTGQSFTDALLFYVRDDQVFMRIQRDRYAIEYPCPAIQPGLKINSAGLRVDNRLQVVYQFKDDGYVPPVVPVPPVVVPGRFYYLQPYISAIHTASPLITNRYSWRAGFSLRGYDASSTGIKAVLSQGTNNMPLSFAPAVRLASSLLVAYFRFQAGVNGTFVVRINGREHFFISSEPLQDGAYELMASGSSFSIARNGNVIAAGNIMPAPNANDNGPLAFGSNVQVVNSSVMPGPGFAALEGYIYSAWLEADEMRYDWPLLDKGEPLQPSTPPGQSITINQHRVENWRFVQD
jgi:hypothetical protein